MNLFTEIDQVDSVLSADGWRPARRAENSTPDGRGRGRRQRQENGKNRFVIGHFTFVICYCFLT